MGSCFFIDHRCPGSADYARPMQALTLASRGQSPGLLFPVYRISASLSRKASSPKVLILKNNAWLPPEVMALR